MPIQHNSSRKNILTFLKRIFMKTHIELYRLTGGLIGGRFLGMAFLILTTVGRKSGKERTTPLFYFPDQGRFIVIASNWSTEKHPVWWLNLQAKPHAYVRVMRQTIPVIARQANAEENIRLWSIIAEHYRMFIRYQKRIKRQIPIIILTPDTDTTTT